MKIVGLLIVKIKIKKKYWENLQKEEKSKGKDDLNPEL